MFPSYRIAAVLCAVGLSSAAWTASAATILPDGTLARTVNDPKVWLVEDGQKHWIVSQDAFLSHGFSFAAVKLVTPEVLVQIPEGEQITEQTRITLPGEADRLPDLAPFAAEDVEIRKMASGQVQLKFTTSFWNRGKGPLELRTNSDVIRGRDGYYDAFQRITGENGSTRDKHVGQIYWHAVHNHFHYVNFADYILQLIKPDVGTGEGVPNYLQKTTFCMRDDVIVRAPMDSVRAPRTYVGCSGRRQGVSVGWADVYPSTLPDQFFDVTNFPAGTYRIRFDIDPNQHFLETSRANNASVALVHVDPAAGRVAVTTFASPFPNSANIYQDGLLVRAEETNILYAVSQGKKRVVKTDEVFASYGTSAKEVEVWPESLTNMIPDTVLIRAKGTSAIYALNNAGWKRHILSPEILTANGWSMRDVVEVSPLELASYPTTDLLRLSTNDDVYSIRTKQSVGPLPKFAGLGLDPASVHTVNALEYHAYGL